MYFIAEIGVNFYDISNKYSISPIDACKLMIKEAKDSGAHCVKFQSYKANTLTCKKSPAYWDLTKEKTKTQYELFKKHDSFNENDFRDIKLYCDSINIDFISTPFDINSAEYLDKYQNMYKISSSDITNLPLLEICGSKKKPVLLSTGASNIEEIKMAVNILEKNGCTKIIIMHCILNYPTPNNQAHLNMLDDIKKHFPNYELGYSDHTLPDDNMLILTTAYLKGATYIEKHFTLDKNLPGNDHYHSADQYDVKKFIKNIGLINIISGSNIKECIKEEEISKLNARRSLVSNNKIKKNDKIKVSDIICKRPGNGISPIHYYNIINKNINIDIEEDTIITNNMLN